MSEAGARRAAAASRFTDVRRYGQVGSTNDVAVSLARAGAGEGVVVVADHQTAGRGRRGRTWTARPGSSLLVSVVLRPGADAGPLSLVPLACGLAAADACMDVAGFAPGLKWPNDVMVGEAKLGGVLTELVACPGGGPPAIVAGLGLNLSWPTEAGAPLDVAVVAADQVVGRPVARDAVLDAYLVHLERRYGGATVLDDYRQRCVTIGRDVRVELPGGSTVEGRATDVAPDGRLAVRDATGAIRLVGAGDVVHAR